MSFAACQCISFADDAKARCSQVVGPKQRDPNLDTMAALEDAARIQVYQPILNKALYDGQFCGVHYALSRPLYHRYKRSGEMALLNIGEWFGLKWTQVAVDEACASSESFEQQMRPVELLERHELLQTPGVAVEAFKKLYHHICKARDERSRFAEAFVFPSCRDQGHKVFASLFDRYAKLCEHMLRWVFAHLKIPAAAAAASVQDDEVELGVVPGASEAAAAAAAAATSSVTPTSTPHDVDVDAILRQAGEDVRREIAAQDALVHTTVRDDLVHMYQRFFMRRRNAMIRGDQQAAAASGREHDASMFAMQHLNYQLEFYQLLFRDMKDALTSELEAQTKKLGRRKLKNALDHHRPLRTLLDCVKVLAFTLSFALDCYLEIIQHDTEQSMSMWIDIDRVILMALAAYEPSSKSISLLRDHLVQSQFQQQMDKRADTWTAV